MFFKGISILFDKVLYYSLTLFPPFQVQALYHHTSTGQYLDIVLVRLDIFKKQPMDLPHYGGDRSRLLDSFCSYAAKHNPASDENPDHWDISLYVSG